jgi:hypothetical protein
MFRHGDILLRSVPAFDHRRTRWKLRTSYDRTSAQPVHAESRVLTAITLAEGEATGHAHVLTASEPGTILARTEGGRTLLRVLTEARLTHQEHADLQVPPGWYEVIRQRVYTPAAPMWVTD